MLGLGAGSLGGGALSARLSPRAALLGVRGRRARRSGPSAPSAAGCTTTSCTSHASWLYTPVWRAALVHSAVLLPPTFLMGMSLPLLARATVRRRAPRGADARPPLRHQPPRGRRSARCWRHGVLIRFYGIRGATCVAAAANVFARTGRAGGGRRAPAASGRCCLRPRAAGESRGRARAHVPLLDPPLRPQRVLRAVAGGGVVPPAGRGAQVERLHLRHAPLRLPPRIGARVPAARRPRRPRGAPAARLPRPAVRAHRLRGPRRRAHRLAALGRRPFCAGTTGTGRASCASASSTGAPGRARCSLYALLPLVLFGPPTFLMGASFPLLQRAVQDDPAPRAARSASCRRRTSPAASRAACRRPRCARPHRYDRAPCA